MSIREHSRKRVTLITGISLLFGDFFVPLQLMKRASYIFLIVLMLAACGGWRDGQRLLDRADSLLYGQPDSALHLLDSITEDDQERMSEAQLMRYHLLRADAQNKCFVPFTTDSVMKEVAHYYERKGTPNEQMRAFYLLGRAYADMGESPAALQAFIKAVDSADTTHLDLFYNQLSKIHGQIGSLYLKLSMPANDLKELEKASVYAKLGHDTLSHIIFESLKANDYYLLGNKDTFLTIKQRVAKMYKLLGDHKNEAIAKGACAYTLIEQNKLTEAKKCLELYEENSGLFDSLGNISPGREIYYSWRGKYYLALGNTDSSEFYYRKLMNNASSLNSRNSSAQGLFEVYKIKGEKDSISKYGSLSIRLNDSVYFLETAQSLQRIEALHHYNQTEREMEQQRAELENRNHKIVVIGLFLLVFVILSLYIMRRLKEKIDLRERDLLDMRRNYEEDTERLRSAREHMSVLESEKTKLAEQNNTMTIEHAHEMKVRDEEISNLSALINVLEMRISTFETKQGDLAPYLESCIQTDIYQHFCYFALHPISHPTEKDWLALEAMMEEHIPSLRQNLIGVYNLKEDSYRLCMLILLKFDPGEIVTLTDSNHDNVAKRRRRLLHKIFKCDGSPSDFDVKLRQMFD